MKLIIAGGEFFTDYPLLKTEVNLFLAELREPFPDIVSGTCQGADTLGEWYAKERGLQIIRMPANWNLYGLKAGPIRNNEMAKIADACIVFWDGNTRSGSYSMICKAKKHHLNLKIIRYD